MIVFQSVKDGKPMNDGNILRRFIKAAAEALKLDVNWRCLRTSCATWMVRARADPKSVQGKMRHSRISTTMEIYAQFVPEGQRQAIRAEKALSRVQAASSGQFSNPPRLAAVLHQCRSAIAAEAVPKK